MGADASIYNLLQTPKLASPLETYGGAMQLKGLIDQQGLHAMQRETLQRDMDSDMRVRDLFSGGRTPSVQEVMGASPKTGMAYQKHVVDNNKAQIETLSKGMGILKDRLPTVRDESSYQAYVETAKSILGPDLVAKLNLPPAFNADWVRNQLVKAEELFTPKPTQTKMPDGSIVTVDMNPFTNPKALDFKAAPGMTPAELDAKDRGWAGLGLQAQIANQPKFNDDRGVFIAPPPVGVPQRGSSVMFGQPPAAAGPAAPRPAAPAAAAGPVAAPVAAPAGSPGVIAVPGVTPRIKPTPGQEALDKEFAKDLASFRTGGGSDQVKQMAQLQQVVTALGGAKDVQGNPIPAENVTGRWQGLMNTLGLSSMVTPRSAAVRERVEEVVQRSLRSILGAQFTEKEGERLISRAFNPYLSEKENLDRVSKLMTQLEQGFQAKGDAAAYFEKNGTLAGWTGKLPAISDFDIPDVPKKPAQKSAPRASVGKIGGIKFIGFED